jgi:hypothetical protein
MRSTCSSANASHEAAERGCARSEAVSASFTLKDDEGVSPLALPALVVSVTALFPA